MASETNTADFLHPKDTAAAEKKTIKGGCHCGFIRYTADLNLDSEGSLKASRCNCTFCLKLGMTNASISESDFKLLSPNSTADGVGDYCRMDTAHKWFCKTCGVHVWAEGSYVYEGNTIDFFTVNVGTIDQPQEGVDLSKVKLSYWDGLHDNWYAGLSEKQYAGGLP